METGPGWSQAKQTALGQARVRAQTPWASLGGLRVGEHRGCALSLGAAARAPSWWARVLACWHCRSLLPSGATLLVPGFHAPAHCSCPGGPDLRVSHGPRPLHRALPSLGPACPPTATESPGTRTPTRCPPGRGRLVPPPGRGPPGSPTAPLACPAPWGGVARTCVPGAPSPTPEERASSWGPRKLPHPRRSGPSPGSERSKRTSSSALPLALPCWKSQVSNKVHLDCCQRGRAWAVHFSGAGTRDTGSGTA